MQINSMTIKAMQFNNGGFGIGRGEKDEIPLC